MESEHADHPENCKEMFALLSEYIDAELPAASCDEIRRHLADCPPCIEFLESLKRSVGLCRDCEPAEPPAPLVPAKKEALLAAYQAFLARRQ